MDRVKKAAEHLACHAVVVEELGTDFQKKASPLAAGLIGAGTGAALGLGTDYFKDKENRTPIQSMLTGALAGGALGAGGSYFMDNNALLSEGPQSRGVKGLKALNQQTPEVLKQLRTSIESALPAERGFGNMSTPTTSLLAGTGIGAGLGVRQLINSRPGQIAEDILSGASRGSGTLDKGVLRMLQGANQSQLVGGVRNGLSLGDEVATASPKVIQQLRRAGQVARQIPHLKKLLGLTALAGVGESMYRNSTFNQARNQAASRAINNAFEN